MPDVYSGKSVEYPMSFTIRSNCLATASVKELAGCQQLGKGRTRMSSPSVHLATDGPVAAGEARMVKVGGR